MSHSIRSMLVAPLVMAVTAMPALASDPVKTDRAFNIHNDRGDGLKIFTPVGKRPINETQLLPAAPKQMPKSMATDELSRIPEVGLDEPLQKSLSKQDAVEQLEYRFALVNTFNLKKTDGFLHALLAQRPDLASLPFRMGADCRLSDDRADLLGEAIGRVRDVREKQNSTHEDESLDQPRVAALMQIKGIREKQAELARALSTIPHVDATVALAKLALYSPDSAAREIAARALKVRREQDYTPLLLEGLRYPYPVVARRAAEALVHLKRKDLASHLVQALEAPDPRLPVQREGSWQARELVRINHHRNCLLCHPPAHTKAVVQLPEEGKEQLKMLRELQEKLAEKKSRDNLLAQVPLPNRSFDDNSDGYGRSDLEHILVRVDVTYLRQDFSTLLPVEDAAPWPAFQRFDFLVRTRTLSDADAQALRGRYESKTPGSPSPYHQAALFGLRELTGLEATTPAEWRRLLKL